MKKGHIYFIFFIIMVLTGYIWLSSSGSLLYTAGGDIYLALGRLVGLLLAISILFQFVVIGRVHWIEKIFGLDTLSRWHHWVGFSTVVFLVIHPVFIACAYGWGSSDSVFHKVVSLLFSGGDVLHATIGAFLFIVVAITSIYVLLKKLKYEYWYAIHGLTYVAIILSVGHQFELGGDLQTATPHILWMLLYISAGGVYIWFRFIKPITQYHRHAFYVSKIIWETKSAYSIYITGKDMESYTYIPGQFLSVRFFAKGVWYEAHPFSISSGSGNGDIRLTIKNSGDYTKKLPSAIHEGTKVFIEGPHGIFGNTIPEDDKILCLVGGIGITPIRSIAQRAVREHKDIKILASFRFHTDTIFKNELTQLVGEENIKFVYTHESPYEGHREHISHSTLFDFCPDAQERSIYLCGPTTFMKAMKILLLQHGVPQEHIHYERFSL